MNREFVPYEQAKALKELGFDEPCFGGYVKLTETQNTFFMNDVISEIDRETPLHKDLITKAPTFSQAFRWFREKDYYSEIRVGCTQIDGGIGYEWWVWKPNGIEEWSIQIPGEEWSYETYGEAEHACLDKLIQIVKTNKISDHEKG